MQRRRLGQTDILVSTLGLGTVKWGRNQAVKYPDAFSLPSDQDILELLALAKDLGINLLDTAPAYGSSEERLGNALKQMRHEFVLTTKVGEEFVGGVSHYNFSRDAIKKSIERSLKRLQTDYLDVVLVHSNGDDVKIIEEDEALQTLDDLKRAGYLRAYGMSTKTIDGGMLAVQHSDVAMVTYHPAYTDELPVIQSAHEKQKGIFIKKALASGHLELFSSPEKIMPFILQTLGVTSVVVGTINPNHLRQNAENVCSSTHR